MSKVTSHDVARAAGVSQPTVSRALRDERGVSPVTRQKVRDAAKALGYVVHQSGRALSTQSTGRVAVVSAELGNPFYPALIEPLHAGLASAGYRTILMTDHGEEPLELEPLIDGSLDAVVLTTSNVDSGLPGELERRGVPYLLLNRTVDGVHADTCVVDNHAGASAVADLLASLGHREIAAIMGPSLTSTGRDRTAGFTSGLGRAGITLPDHLLHTGVFSADTGAQGLRRLLAQTPRPTAVFCGNDVIAFGVLNTARTMGIDIPGELTVVGFDNIPMSAWPVLDLTTVAADLAVMALAAVELLVSRLANPNLPYRERKMQPRIILRGTHGGSVA